jgi:hypothetical protein
MNSRHLVICLSLFQGALYLNDHNNTLPNAVWRQAVPWKAWLPNPWVQTWLNTHTIYLFPVTPNSYVTQTQSCLYGNQWDGCISLALGNTFLHILWVAFLSTKAYFRSIPIFAKSAIWSTGEWSLHTAKSHHQYSLLWLTFLPDKMLVVVRSFP